MNKSTAEARVDIDAPPSKMWRSLTDPVRIREYYLGAEVETDWQVGSPITFKCEWVARTREPNRAAGRRRPNFANATRAFADA